MRPDVRAQWDELRQHDVLFLLTLRPPDAVTAGYLRGARQAAAAQNGQGQAEPNPMEQYGLQYVRGCEVIEIRDEGAC